MSLESWLDVRTVTKVFVSLLLLVSVISSVALLIAAGPQSLPIVFPVLYLTGLLAVGVFRDAMRTRWWRSALSGGVIVWGVTDYVVGENGWLSLALVAVGVLMFVGVLYEE